MALTGKGLAAFAKSKVGTPYVYGAKLSDGPLKLSKLNQLKKLYPNVITSSYYTKAKRFVGKVCTDCSGLISGYTGKLLGSSALYSNASSRNKLNKNDCSKIPVGAVLWKSGHVGVYLGNGKVAEALGINYGTVISDVSRRTFTHWLLFDWMKYDSVSTTTKKSTTTSKKNPYKEPTRTLTVGCKGDDVRWLQWELDQSGFKCKIDGQFGSETKKQLAAFKAKVGLTPTITSVGPKTISALKKAS